MIPASKFMPLMAGAARAARVEFDPYGKTPNCTLADVVCNWCTALNNGRGELRHTTFAAAQACWDTRRHQHVERKPSGR